MKSCVGIERQSAFANQHSYISPIRGGNIFAVTEAQEIVRVCLIEKRVGARVAVNRCQQSSAEWADARWVVRGFK